MTIHLFEKVETTPTSPKEVLLSVPIEKSSSAVEITVKSPSRDADLCLLSSPTQPMPQSTLSEKVEEEQSAEPRPCDNAQTTVASENTQNEVRIKDSTSSTSSSASNHTVLTSGGAMTAPASAQLPSRVEESLDKRLDKCEVVASSRDAEPIEYGKDCLIFDYTTISLVSINLVHLQILK